MAKPDAAEDPDRREAHRQPDGRPDRHLLEEQHDHVGEAVVGLLDPLDEADHQQDRHRIVEARLGLERPGEAAPQRRGAQQGEDRRAVRDRQDRPEQEPLERREPEQPRGGEPGDHGRDQRADAGEHQPRSQHRPDLSEAGGQPTLEEDRRQGDDAHPTRELVVGEVDPAEAVGPHDHAEGKEEQQPRHLQPAREERPAERGRQQRPGHQDELTVSHLSASVPEHARP